MEKHKEFEDYEVSKKVETISDNEWIVYYYTNSPWPMPDNDCVAKMSYTEDDQGTASFSIIAAPAMFEMKNVDRMTYYEVVYTFKDLGNDKVELMVDAKMSPTIQAPDWMVSSFFPNGPAGILRKISELAKSS